MTDQSHNRIQPETECHNCKGTKRALYFSELAMAHEMRDCHVCRTPHHERSGVLTSDEALMLMQARYVLRNLNAERPGCGYDKLAEACGQAASVVSSAEGK